ncbi:response regulator [Pontixanthobacter aquaemixtae]|uniref:Response regulator n=1 Tax=Pontixanthobacter aquaemixtae TaxID=1958940 RepID=A0A844ZRQ8_9SPHN|nr:response regulator [Pontixanthobacter aquaemixtae]MXO89770.1 response regulator [Pontixanthobacter aquaemixtae]
MRYGRRGPDAAVPHLVAERAPARNCLIVDDSRMIRKVTRKIVEPRGYLTDEAENGEEALAKCKIAMPDLIILDWDMPVMTGIEFLTELRQLNGGQQPKVVFCTTHSQAVDVHQAVQAGANEFVTKPFCEESLVAKLGNIGAV